METTNAPEHKTKGKIELYVYQTRVSIADGIHFYETGEIENPYLKGISFSKNTLSLPPEGYITTHRGFIYHPLYCAGINQLLPDRTVSLNVKCILNNDKQYFETKFSPYLGKISKYINQTLHVSINEYQHLFGSRLLCAQDPIFLKIGLKLKRTQNQLSIMFFLRDQKEFNGCHCAIQTGSPIFQHFMELYEIKERVITIPYSHRKSSISNETDYLLIWNSKGALIEKIPLIFFGEKICSTYKSRELPSCERVPVWPESYYTDKSSSNLNFIEEGIQHRKHLYLSEINECCYFKKGEKTKDGEYTACRCVQNLLSQAGLEIIICDPYFDVSIIRKFIKGWVHCKSLTIITNGEKFSDQIKNRTESESNRVINIKKAINKAIHSYDASEPFAILYINNSGSESLTIIHDKQIEHKINERPKISCNLIDSLDIDFQNKIDTVFRKDIQSCANTDCFVSFSIYYAQSTAEGKNILHDRHIVIDGNVWGIGTSLNSLGKKDTTIFKPQNQEAILSRIKEWKSQSAVYEWRKEYDNYRKN